MENYDSLTREELIERLKRVERDAAGKLREMLDGEKRIAKSLMLVLQNYNGSYEEDIMRVVLEHFKADRAFLFQFNWEKGTSSVLFEVDAEGVSSKIHSLKNLPNAGLGEHLDGFREGIPLFVEDVEKLGDMGYYGKNSMKEVFQKLQLKYAVFFPMRIFGELWGYVGVESTKMNKDWSEVDIDWLNAFTDVLCIGVSQKLIRNEANESEQRFKTLFENMPLGFVRHRLVTDENNVPVDYEFVEVNPAFEKYTGLKKEDCLGKTALQLGGRLNEELFKDYVEVAHHGKQLQLEYYTPMLKGWFSSVLYSPEPGEFISLFYDETESHNAHELIRQNEKKLRSIFESLTVGVISYDKDGNYLDSNHKIVEIFRFNSKDEVDKSVLDTAKFKGAWKMDNEFAFDFIYDTARRCRVVDKNDITDDCRFLVGKFVMHTNDAGECIGYLLQIINNTEIYKAYQKIHDSEQIWTRVSEAAQMFNWKYSSNTRQYSVSDDIYRFGSLEGKDKMGLLLDYVKHIRMKDQMMLWERWKKSLAGECNVPYELNFEIKLGDQVKYCSSRWCKKMEDEVEVVYGITFDISELMLVEKALKENLVRMSLILESGDIYPWYLDVRTGLLDVSEEFFRAFHCEKPNLGGYRISDFIERIHPDDIASFTDLYGKLQAGAIDRMRIEIRLNAFNKGYKWFEVNAAVKARGEYSNITQLLGFLTMIQERKDNETRLVEALKKAEESDKLKSAFLANVSHEIRTPLNAIIGFSEIIAALDEPEEKKYYLDIIKTNNNLLLNLINDILDLSKIESGRIDLKESVRDVSALCRELCDMHQLRVGSNVKVIFENQGESLMMLTDFNRLHQLYSNLIGNAVKNTPAGTIRVGYQRMGDQVTFFVKDTGRGIPKDKQPLIFNRFEKLDSSAQGFGLGLSICKSILEKMGGSISFKSEVGVGTEFEFTLPYRMLEEFSVSGGRELKKVAENPLMRMACNEALTILVAEDIDYNYKLLEAILGKSYRLIHAVTGNEAVTCFLEKHPDLILMDMKMPELDGIEATRIIRQLSPDIPIIALTAFAYDSDKDIALAAGCNDFLTKPVEASRLKEMIKEYIGVYGQN